MAIQTYQKDGKIYDATGQHIQSLADYQAGLRTGKYLPAKAQPSSQPYIGGLGNAGVGERLGASLALQNANQTEFQRNPTYMGAATAPKPYNPYLATTKEQPGFKNFSYPWEAPQQTQQQNSGSGSGGYSVSRDGAGYTVAEPPKQTEPGWYNQADFIETARNIIRKKLDQNSDIQGQRDYWRSLIRDTSPFGGARDAADQTAGRFTDTDLRLLSPEQQSSIRAARMGAAQAHLQGLSEEERFRGSRMDDVISTLSDFYKEKKDELEMLKRDATQQEELAIKKAQLELSKRELALNASGNGQKSMITNSMKVNIAKKIGIDPQYLNSMDDVSILQMEAEWDTIQRAKSQELARNLMVSYLDQGPIASALRAENPYLTESQANTYALNALNTLTSPTANTTPSYTTKTMEKKTIFDKF
jgi:hypothetical protein